MRGDGYTTDDAHLSSYLEAMHAQCKTSPSERGELNDAIRAAFTKVKMAGEKLKTPVIYLDNLQFRSYKSALAYIKSDNKESFGRSARPSQAGMNKRTKQRDLDEGERPAKRHAEVAVIEIDDSVATDDDAVGMALQAAGIIPRNESFGACVRAVCEADARAPYVFFRKLSVMVASRRRLAVHVGVHLRAAGVECPYSAKGKLDMEKLSKGWLESKLMTSEQLWAILWAAQVTNAEALEGHIDQSVAQEDARIANECIGDQVANASYGAHVHATYSNQQVQAPCSFAGEVVWMLSSRLQHAMYIGRYLSNEGLPCPFDADGRFERKVLAKLWLKEKMFGAEHLWAIMWGIQSDSDNELIPPIDEDEES